MKVVDSSDNPVVNPNWITHSDVTNNTFTVTISSHDTVVQDTDYKVTVDVAEPAYLDTDMKGTFTFDITITPNNIPY